jgi:hypothetical protein
VDSQLGKNGHVDVFTTVLHSPSGANPNKRALPLTFKTGMVVANRLSSVGKVPDRSMSFSERFSTLVNRASCDGSVADKLMLCKCRRVKLLKMDGSE